MLVKLCGNRQSYVIIFSAMYGIIFNVMISTLYRPRNEYIAMLNASREIENHLECIRWAKLARQTHISVERSNSAMFIIEHHMKKAVTVSMSMVFLLFLSVFDTIFSLYETGNREFIFWLGSIFL